MTNERKIVAGDRVNIGPTTVKHKTPSLVGLTAVVLDVEGDEIYVHPLTDRPDGWERGCFYWPAAALVLLSDDDGLDGLRSEIEKARAAGYSVQCEITKTEVVKVVL